MTGGVAPPRVVADQTRLQERLSSVKGAKVSGKPSASSESVTTQGTTLTDDLSRIGFTDGDDSLFASIRELQLAAEVAILCNVDTPKGASVAKIRDYVYKCGFNAPKLAKYLSTLRKLEDASAQYQKYRNLYVNWWRAAFYTTDTDIVDSLLQDMHRHVHPARLKKQNSVPSRSTTRSGPCPETGSPRVNIFRANITAPSCDTIPQQRVTLFDEITSPILHHAASVNSVIPTIGAVPGSVRPPDRPIRAQDPAEGRTRRRRFSISGMTNWNLLPSAISPDRVEPRKAIMLSRQRSLPLSPRNRRKKRSSEPPVLPFLDDSEELHPSVMHTASLPVEEVSTPTTMDNAYLSSLTAVSGATSTTSTVTMTEFPSWFPESWRNQNGRRPQAQEIFTYPTATSANSSTSAALAMTNMAVLGSKGDTDGVRSTGAEQEDGLADYSLITEELVAGPALAMGAAASTGNSSTSSAKERSRVSRFLRSSIRAGRRLSMSI